MPVRVRKTSADGVGDDKMIYDWAVNLRPSQKRAILLCLDTFLVLSSLFLAGLLVPGGANLAAAKALPPILASGAEAWGAACCEAGFARERG